MQQYNQIKNITLKSLFVFSLGSLFYLYDFVLQVSPSVMTHPLMSHFQINATTLGIIIGVYFYFYTAFQIPAGLLLDLFDARRVLVIVISCCATGAFIFALAPSIYFIALGRMLMGAGSAFAFLGSLYLALRWLPASMFALFVGFVQMLGSFGAAIGEAPFAFLIDHIGWRDTMLAFSIAGFCLALLVFLFVSDPDKQIQQKKTRSQIFSLMRQNLYQIIKYQQTWVTGLYALFIWAPITTFASLWGVPFLKEAYQLTTFEAGTAITTVWIAIAIACPIAGWASDKMKNRCKVMSLLAAIGLIGISVVIYINHLPLWVLYLCLALVGAAAAGQSVSFALIKDNQPLHLTGAANGFNNMCIVLSGALFQPLLGRLLDLDWHGGFIHGVRHYTVANFHFAFFIIPCFYIISLVTSVFFLRETHCLSKQDLSENTLT